MRKCLILLLTLALLCPASASAAEGPKYIALTFDGFPVGEDGRALLEGLADRDARATFFLGAVPWEQGRQILDGGHELGLLAPDLSGLSRRTIGRELTAIRALMPSCRVRFLRTGTLSDGARQVAKAQKLTILKATLDPWAEAPGGRTVLERAEPGDVLVLSGETEVNLALNLIDILENRGFRLVTATELARLQRGSRFDIS